MAEGEQGEQIGVLLVEDDEPTRFWLRLTLEPERIYHIVGEAEDGKTAVQLALQHKPRVVLMDIGLPVVDGVAASKQIKEALPETRIIMFTSHDSDDSVFAALTAGCDGYCLKSLTAEQLLKAISSVCDGAAWLDPGIANRVLRAASAQTQVGADKEQQNPFALSARETDVLVLLVEGLSNQQIAERLHLGTETVKTHMRHIMRKLAVSDRTQAAIKAMREGIVKNIP